MGLVYNHKDKSGLVILAEEKQENDEGKLPGFVILPDSETSDVAKADNNQANGQKSEDS